MDTKPKAGGVKKRAAKAAAKTEVKPQRERFIEAARVVGVDETGAEFERVIKMIVPPRKTRQAHTE